MFIEVMGLPGSGKSTVLNAAQPLFDRADLQVVTFRHLARAVANKQCAKNSYLKRYKGRAWLFGAMAVANENPDVFQAFLDNFRDEFKNLLWAMEFLAQYHFASQADHSDKVVLIDEGFLHRGTTAFLQDRTKTKLIRYLDKIPTSDVIISVDISAEDAIERCRSRTPGIPEVYNADNNEDVIANFSRLQKLMHFAISHQIKAGARVIHIDGAATPEESAAKLFTELAAIAATKGLSGGLGA